MAFSLQNALTLTFLVVNVITLYRGFSLARYLRSHRDVGASLRAFYHIVLAIIALVLPLAILMVESLVYPIPQAPEPFYLTLFNAAIYTGGTVWAAYGVHTADILVRKA